jgi:transcriptional regulator with XRE-family HTH domain
MASFSNRLKELRKEKNLTQRELADILNIKERNYQRYEYEEVNPPISKLIVLSNFYNVSIDYLLGQSEFKERYSNEKISEMKYIYYSSSIADKLENLATELRNLEEDARTRNTLDNNN